MNWLTSYTRSPRKYRVFCLLDMKSWIFAIPQRRRSRRPRDFQACPHSWPGNRTKVWTYLTTTNAAGALVSPVWLGLWINDSVLDRNGCWICGWLLKCERLIEDQDTISQTYYAPESCNETDYVNICWLSCFDELESCRVSSRHAYLDMVWGASRIGQIVHWYMGKLNIRRSYNLNECQIWSVYMAKRTYQLARE